MPGSMSQADLVVDLKNMLQDAAAKFTEAEDADFVRHLTIAAQDLGRFRHRTKLGSVTLEADKNDYPAPADMIKPKVGLWGLNERRTRKPWQRNFPQTLPQLDVIEGDSGIEIHLNPAPTAEQIADLGQTFKFYYFAGHSIADDAAQTTVRSADRHLLLIRAAAQALFELAANGISKPVQLGPGVGSMPKNGTPGALSDQLLKQFVEMAA